jgi:hypothetical protein
VSYSIETFTRRLNITTQKDAPYQRNEAAEIGSGVKEAIGKEPHNFETFAHDYALMFD